MRIHLLIKTSINNIILFNALFIAFNLFSQECPVKLFAFVGEKISVEKKAVFRSENLWGSDYSFLAKYKVIEEIYGHITVDTVEFIVFDHYGFPPFAAHKNVLLYISCDNEGTWHHQKYSYNAVYKTVDGKWAGVQPTNYYSTKQSPTKSIPAEQIELFKAEWEVYKKSTIPSTYEEPDIIKGYQHNQNYYIFGNYSQDLFKIKKSQISNK